MIKIEKIKLIVLIAIVSILITGCVQTPKQDIATTVTPTLTPTPTPTNAPTTISTPEIPKAAELKIMSVTTGQATLGGIPVIVKVKNIGDGIAKDVYAGVILMYHSPPASFENYPDKNALLNRSIYEALVNGSSRIDTGFVYTDNERKFSDLIVVSTLNDKDYIGDISSGEIKTAQFTMTVDTGYSSDVNSYVKVAWTDDKKEYTIY